MNKEKTTTLFKKLCSSIKSFKKILKSKEHRLMLKVRLWLKNDCLKMKIYTSKVVNLSVEAMKAIVEDIIDLLQDKSNLSSPYRSVFVISSSCFFKMLSSIFLMLIKRNCVANWERGQLRRKWVIVSISRPKAHIGLI